MDWCQALNINPPLLYLLRVLLLHLKQVQLWSRRPYKLLLFLEAMSLKHSCSSFHVYMLQDNSLLPHRVTKAPVLLLWRGEARCRGKPIAHASVENRLHCCWPRLLLFPRRKPSPWHNSGLSDVALGYLFESLEPLC